MIIIFFSLPIATPPNAIAFSYGYLETVDMIKVGTLLNILCVLVTAMLLPIVAFPAYSLGEFPAWAVMSADGAGDVLVNATMTTLGNISLDHNPNRSYDSSYSRPIGANKRIFCPISERIHIFDLDFGLS